MSASSSRAHVISRAHSSTSWDAGVHAESDLGGLDLGVAVDEQSLGLVVDSPQLGRIRIALDLDAQGVTRLTALSRQLADGRDVPTETPADEAPPVREGQDGAQDERVAELALAREQLEAHVRALDERAAGQQAERERLEARVRELEADVEARSAEVRRALEEADTELQQEESAHREARAELERLEAERVRLRGQLTQAEATLEEVRRELAEARANSERLDAELASARGTQAQLEAQLRAPVTDDGADARVAALEAELQETAARERALTDDVARLQAELTSAAANLAGVEAAQDARIAELERALAAAELAAQRLPELEIALTQAQAAAGRAADLEISMTALQDAAARTPALEAALAEAQEAAGRATSLESSLAEVQQARAELALQLQQAQGVDPVEVEQLRSELAVATQQLAESQEVVQAWQTALATEQAATAEAREVARHLKAQVDALIAERDEARTIARQLHQRLATSADPSAREPSAKLSSERDRLALQVESLERQLEGERSARARAMAERDALKARIELETNREVTEAPTVERPAFYRGTKP
jgi:chromosome segregation ATPase